HQAAASAPAAGVGGGDEPAAEAFALAGRVHRQHAEVAPSPAQLDVDTGDEPAVRFREQERSRLEQTGDLGRVRAVAVDEEPLHEEGLVDEGGDGGGIAE